MSGHDGDGLTRAELSALVAFLAAVLNDPDTLGTSGLNGHERNAVHRAYSKLWLRAVANAGEPPGRRR